MRKSIALATTAALVLALAACGGPATDDEADDAAAPAADAEVTAEADPADTAAEGEPAAGEEDAAEPEPTASATPAPTATATATRAPAPAVAMAPPAKFTTCTVCHSVEPGQNLVGPTLAGVVGRRAGSVSGANYSPALQGANITWNEANLRRYLVDPAAVVPGGIMPPPGLSAAEAQAIVNYLKTL